MTKRSENKADRERIRKADPVKFLIAVMEGRPMPVRDEAGQVIGTERVDAPLRAAAAEKLLRRILPELKSVEMSGEGGVSFRVVAPDGMALPNSQPGDDAKLIEGRTSASDLADIAAQLAEAVTEGDDDDR